MKAILNQIVPISIVILFLMCFPTILHAQGDPGNPDAPIDGGLSILIAAGVGYGVKKVRDNRKKKQEENIKD